MTPRSALQLLSVVVAGEAIFVMPFVMVRLFRPTLLRHWDMTHTSLNVAMSVYGFTAIGAYLASGFLADRFRPRWLMAAGLLATAGLGIAMAGRPTPTTLAWVYAGYGITTILLFWSPMIRVTHELGGRQSRGLAFGILDGGRGLFAAILAILLVGLLDGSDAAVGRIIACCIGVTVAAGALVAMTLGGRDVGPTDAPEDRFRWQRVAGVLRLPAVWLQGGVLLCAYVGFKMTDYLGVLGSDVHSMDERTAASLATLAFWLRPPAALAAGWVSDRVDPFAAMMAMFTAMAIGCAALVLSCGGSLAWLYVGVLTTAASVYALRGVYFAVMDELDVPPMSVGTAAGVISMVGYLPDIFFGPLVGLWLDRHDDAVGYASMATAIAAVAIVGAGLSVWQRRRRRGSTHQ